MRGLYFGDTGSLDNLTVAELPVPEPAAGEVLVKVAAAAINPSDPKTVLGAMATSTPRVPGRDFAGRVVGGEPAWRDKAVFGTGGDLGLFRDGSHAEYLAVPAAGVVEIPAGLGYDTAAAISLGYLTAYGATVLRGRVRSGDTVLVTGATGSVGAAAIRIAAWQGARVLGAVRSTRSLAGREDLPSAQWIDLATSSLPESVHDMTEGRGADLVVDTVGGPVFEDCLASLAPYGRQVAVASVGTARVGFNLVDFYRKEATLTGLNTLNLSFREAADALRELLPEFQQHVFPPPPVQRISLEDSPSAYRTLEAGAATKKLVISFDDDS